MYDNANLNRRRLHFREESRGKMGRNIATHQAKGIEIKKKGNPEEKRGNVVESSSLVEKEGKRGRKKVKKCSRRR